MAFSLSDIRLVALLCTRAEVVAGPWPVQVHPRSRERMLRRPPRGRRICAGAAAGLRL